MALKVDCPTCSRKTEFSPGNLWRPFCSERCKTADLGGWASEAYRIAGDARDDLASSDQGEAASFSARPHS